MTDLGHDWQALFKFMPAPCIAVDLDLRILAASDLYLATVGRNRDDILGEYVFDAFPEEAERLAMFEDAFRRAAGGEANALVEVPYAIPATDTQGRPTGQMREIWWTCHHHPVLRADGSVHYVVQKAQDVTRQVMAERLKDTVVQELQHRVGNIFALVSSTVKRTVANSNDFADFLPKVEGRLMALSRTHRYLTGKHWDGMTLDKIVTRELSEYDDTTVGQIDVSGADILVNATEAQILTLAIHELTTNSLKYGALRTPEGRLQVRWTDAGAAGYDFEWREDGISIAGAPDRKGFGSFILDSVVPAQLQGTAQRDFQPSAFSYRLSVPERALQR